MKNKISVFIIAFMIHCLTCGYAAEDQAAAGKQADNSISSSQETLQALRAKTAQARAVLSEIQNLLGQETKILNKILDQKDQAKKNKAALAEYDRAIESIRQDIQQTRDQLKEAENNLAAYARQSERLSRLQAEYEKAQKESQDSEAQARLSGEKLAAAQKNLAELKAKFAELAKQSDEAKKQTQNFENTKARLEAEKTKRAETLARAEAAVEAAEKTEKERLALASRLAELEQNVTSVEKKEKQGKEASELAGLQGEIEKETTAIRENEEKIKKDENARAETEKKILELKKQLQSRSRTERGAENEAVLNGLKDRLAALRKQRAADEARLKYAEEQLRAGEKSVEALTNSLAAAGNEPQQDAVSARARVQGEIDKEQKALDETRNATAQNEKAFIAAEKNIAELKQQLKELEKKTRSGAGKDAELARLRERLAGVKNQRAAVDKRLNETETGLRECEKTIAGLTNMLAAAGKQDEKNKGNARAIVALTGELEQETAQLNKVAAGVDRQTINLKALEDEKRRLGESLALVSQKTAREGALTNKLDEVRLQVAGQKKIRTDMESKLEQTARDQAALEKETQRLKQALVEAGTVILNSQAESRENERLADELRKEKELARKSADLLREKEQELKRLGEEKQSLQDRLSQAAEKKAQQGKQAEDDQAAVKSGLESEKKALLETEEKNVKAEKTLRETGDEIAGLKKQLKALEESARSKPTKESDKTNSLRSQIAGLHKQRVEAEEQLQKTETKLNANRESIAALTNSIASLMSQQEKDLAAVKSAAILAKELENEKALADDAGARVEKQNNDFKALEAEKRRLEDSLSRLKGKSSVDKQETNKTDDLAIRIAVQKKIRTDMEAKLEQATREREALEKETKALDQSLAEAKKLISQNESDSKKAGRIADELQDEQEMTKKSADLLREKEKDLARLGKEKDSLQAKYNEARKELARQKALITDLETKRGAIEEEKANRSAYAKKQAELAGAEKEQQDQMKDLENKTRAAEKERRRLAAQGARAAPEVEKETAAGEMAEARTPQKAQSAAVNSDKDAVALEQEILSQAKAVAAQPADQQPEKKTGKQSKSQTRRNNIAEADKHYALAIQKWDEDDVDGAVEEFKMAASLNPDAAGAYYNLSLASLRQGKKEEACDYAYMAGEAYIRIKNLPQATRMAVLMNKINKNSPLIQKLRNKIAMATR